jgi:long-chain acyl-CoA synthetase
MEKIWLKHYPAGVPAEVATDRYPSLAALLDECLRGFHDSVAYRFMGRAYTFAQVDAASRDLAAYLQGLALERGERVAVMLPNVPQYPVAVVAILRAGGVVVNLNPLATPREIEHQLKDSGARVIVLLEHYAGVLQELADALPVREFVVAAMGDMLGAVKGRLVNHLARSVRRQVPEFRLPGAVAFNDALARGHKGAFAAPAIGPDDIAVLQYTGGTTGVAKAAVLLHRNIVANVLQCEAWFRPALDRLEPGEAPVTVCVLPLYHIFGFTAAMMLGLHVGGCGLLIPDPRDVGAMLKELAHHRFHSLPGVNSLFAAIAHHPDFDSVDWSTLKLAVGGGMAVQRATAKLWFERTGCPICEGYGLTETSPTVSCNPVDAAEFDGTIGLPLPGTEIELLDDDGREVAPGLPGEIAVRGPQVMAGYWQRPDETARVMTADGFFRTGDIGSIDERGRLRIVDRKKDLILVSGFDVYPNEIEEVVGAMPGVLECAAVGVPDSRSGEAVRLVVVRADPALAEADVRAYCEAHLPGYKRPRQVEFRAELPKSSVGKVLRRELRNGHPF